MLSFDPPDRYARWAPLPLRLIVGLGFMEHGFAKLSKGPDAFAAILQGLAVPAPHLTAWLMILVEIGIGRLRR
jgi:putative oxidoreductase